MSVFEYGIGCLVGAGPKSYTSNGTVDSWDYSNEPFNINGIVSLRHFISWGVLGLLLEWFHPKLVEFIKHGIVGRP